MNNYEVTIKINALKTVALSAPETVGQSAPEARHELLKA